MKKIVLSASLLLIALASQAQDTLTAYFDEVDQGFGFTYQKVERIYKNGQTPTFDFSTAEKHPLNSYEAVEEGGFIYENADEYLIYEVPDLDLELAYRVEIIERTETKVSYYYEEHEEGELLRRDSVVLTLDKSLGSHYDDIVVGELLHTLCNTTNIFDTTYYEHEDVEVTATVRKDIVKQGDECSDEKLDVTHYIDSTLQDDAYDKLAWYEVDSQGSYVLDGSEESWYTNDQLDKFIAIGYDNGVVSDSTVQNFLPSEIAFCNIYTESKYAIANLSNPIHSKIEVCYTDDSEEIIVSDKEYDYDSTSMDYVYRSHYEYEYENGVITKETEYDGDNNVIGEILFSKKDAVYKDEGDVWGKVYFDKPELVGLEEQVVVNLLSLYPNPVENVIKLEKSGKGNIYSIEGELVKSFDGNQVDVNTLVQGMYMIKLVDESGLVYSNKFIKK